MSAPPHRLRPVRPGDAPAVLAAFASSPDMVRQGDVTSLPQAQEMIGWLEGPSRRGIAIVHDGATEAGRGGPGGGELVGLVGVSIEEPHSLGWFFYWLHASFRGQGVTSRAAAAVANRGLRPVADGGWGLERLELGHRVNNPASGAVARAAGFVHEGTERQKFLLDGERHDVLTYGRLRSDPVPSTSELPWSR
ncbi:GNAT family N-acetyltransferase [Brachybacterium sp. 107]|uniref:GNAT family N-acetyltransferase n=1 Tax=Brachybacterium sp. 107 TaxID=3457736 RepID=UPI004034B514